MRLNLFTAAKTVDVISQQRELSGAAWHPVRMRGIYCERFLVASLLGMTERN